MNTKVSCIVIAAGLLASGISLANTINIKNNDRSLSGVTLRYRVAAEKVKGGFVHTSKTEVIRLRPGEVRTVEIPLLNRYAVGVITQSLTFHDGRGITRTITPPNRFAARVSCSPATTKTKPNNDLVFTIQKHQAQCAHS